MKREHALCILRLSEPTTPGEIKSAYRRLARQHHPDKGGCSRRMTELNLAYAILRNTTANQTKMTVRESRMNTVLLGLAGLLAALCAFLLLPDTHMRNLFCLGCAAWGWLSTISFATQTSS